MSKISQMQVIEANRDLYLNGVSRRELAVRLGISLRAVHKITALPGSHDTYHMEARHEWWNTPEGLQVFLSIPWHQKVAPVENMFHRVEVRLARCEKDEPELLSRLLWLEKRVGCISGVWGSDGDLIDKLFNDDLEKEDDYLLQRDGGSGSPGSAIVETIVPDVDVRYITPPGWPGV